jgi:ubiquinone/menaquinone biosynthesis C-methylase UbiE
MQRIPEQDGGYDHAAEVDAYIAASNRPLFARIEKLFVRDVLKDWKNASDLKVLDLGTGPGWIPVGLKQARPDWQITAVDASDLMLKSAGQYAQSRGVAITWRQAFAEQTGLEANQFDLVLSHFAFHEFSNPGPVLQEIARITKSGGTVLVQDWERPTGVMKALALMSLRLFYLASPRARNQAIASLQAAYTEPELSELCHAVFPKAQVRPLWCSFVKLLRVTAIKP